MRRRSILFRGAGDLVSGAIRRAHLAGFAVACTEIAEPLCVRRKVSFSEAVHEGIVTVEGVTAEAVRSRDLERVWERRRVPVVVDPDLSILETRRFDALVDGTMAKRNLGTRIDHAPLVVALGPGFTAGRDCHAVVETLSGHDLGRVIWDGPAAADTGVPAPPAAAPSIWSGRSPHDVLLRAPADGTFHASASIGDVVDEGQVVGDVDGHAVTAALGGVLRGLIRPGRRVERGLKIGDVDPSCEVRRAYTIGERSNAIGGGVLEALLTRAHVRPW
jgi:xanthine dehydrogenase accessory factor